MRTWILAGLLCVGTLGTGCQTQQPRSERPGGEEFGRQLALVFFSTIGLPLFAVGALMDALMRWGQWDEREPFDWLRGGGDRFSSLTPPE